MWDEPPEPPAVIWTKDSIVVYDIKEDMFSFLPNRMRSNILYSSPEIEEFDEYPEKIMPFDSLYEMVALAKLIKNREYLDTSVKQMQLTKYHKK